MVRPTLSSEKYRQQSPDHKAEDDDERDKTVAGDAFLIAQWPQALDAAGRQIVDQLGIRSRWPAKMIFQSLPECGQVVLSHIQLIILWLCRLGLRLDASAVHLLKD